MPIRLAFPLVLPMPEISHDIGVPDKSQARQCLVTAQWADPLVTDIPVQTTTYGRYYYSIDQICNDCIFIYECRT
jgi:hypothetical protein